VVKKRQHERARLAHEQATLQSRIINQQWQHQNQQSPDSNSHPAVHQPNIAPGIDSSNYNSIYWNPQQQPMSITTPQSADFRAANDLPPSYSAVNFANSPPSYTTAPTNKY
jgi:hypothetical protein